jgi:hypothetical protein
MSNGSYMSGSSGAAGNTDQTAGASPPRIVLRIQNHITISDFTRISVINAIHTEYLLHEKCTAKGVKQANYSRMRTSLFGMVELCGITSPDGGRNS